ncbi:efflux RND transporter permease subunit [Chitinivorax sp. B]|uniref:efflux RND transporter permease subunit n=1 Tax=Chitinivorax sp. B TaxID=2502235 RepID=UPI0010F807FF|nr:efflux RND transporter permease subunit [Chitinivorax sp. B]
MTLSDLSIKRPVLATVMSLAIILVGIMSFLRLSVREYPNIDTPIVSVRTVYKGASPQVIESQVTQPLEDSLSGIEGIRTIKSVSREEVSQITVEFIGNRDVDSAANDVRDRVARVKGRLPEAADDSVVAKIEADAQAIIWIGLSSDLHSSIDLSDYADRTLADQIKTLPGVASVIIGGERRRAMRLWLDRDKLAANGLTVQDVENALRKQNVEIPSGRIESQQREFTVLAETDLQTPQQFTDMVISEANGYPLRLGGIGRAEVGAQDERNTIRYKGQPAIGMGVVKQSTANTLAVAQAVKNLLPTMRANLPQGMRLQVTFDSSIFIERSIDAVYHAMLEALILVILVVFLFLRSFRATLIPFVTIPVSLIGAFIFLQLFGFTINVLTLLGIVLAIGLVVDDAIVVLENIHRHIEAGMPPIQAAFRGSREIAFAVIAMTVTLAAVFTPLAFMQGNTGKLFGEFALTVAAAVLVSGFIALTLTPMMCSRLLKHEARHGAIYNAIEQVLVRLHDGYRTMLAASLRQRWVTAYLFAGCLGGAGWLYLQLPSELSPTEDRGFFITVVVAPDGASFDYTDRYTRQLEGILAGIPEAQGYFTIVAPGLERPNPVNSALGFVQLKPWDQRQAKQQDITKALGGQLFGGLPGVLAFAINPPSLGQSFRNPAVQFVLTGNSYEALEKNVDKLMSKLRQYPGIANPDTDLKLNKPQLAVTVDRDKAASIGVEVESIGRTMESLLGGRQVTRFKFEGKQYDVIVQMDADSRARPDDLAAIYVRNAGGQLIQLSNLVTVSETVAPKELNHFNRQRAAIISANVSPGYTLGQVLDELDKITKTELGDNTQTALDGQSREFRESGGAMMLTFVLALAFIYLVLSAQFESFISPLVIMLTVPLAMAGALLALRLTNGSLNVYSQIGLVMLVGLITKHGILIVEFANQLRDQGRDKFDAVTEAATLRLRPILMTTGAMVLGSLPLAMATGAGAEARQPIGWVIMGGLMFGTLLTLFVIPTAYTLLVGKHKPQVMPIMEPTS